ncbi:Bug family tripartite tricarboxylate transporter substrate binding protein [Paeniroseomonas aquatica]|uniref:Bug family tripartite tricarboxylate transporter substrate binding protein n=1 Tax=Paeniroseomonas aquatica TaxID=373043 RepID=UPI003622D7CB
MNGWAPLPRRAAAALLLGAAARPARAETYPARPIRLIVAFGPGSGSDVRARLYADRLAAAWGQPVVVDNRGGGSGILAAEAVARARPDGYTLLFTSNTTHAANPVLFRRLPYDPVADFAPVALIGRTPLVVVVSNDLPVRDMAGLIAHARAHPGALNYASGNTSSHLAAEMFKAGTGVSMTYVSYRSNAQAILDVIAGAAQVMFSDAVVALPQIRQGRVRALAVTVDAAVPALPGVPTVAGAAGLPGYAVASWSAIFAPAGTPAEIVARLNAEVIAIGREPGCARA